MGTQISTELSLDWNGEMIPAGGKLDTHVDEINKKMIVRATGSNPIVRTRESITRDSGVMSWRMRCGSLDGKTNKYFYLGVVGANYTGTKHNSPSVWLCCGNAKYWQDTGAIYVDVNNETSRKHSFMFAPGDVVEMTFDPLTQILSARVEGKDGFVTSRRIEGDGVAEVHPCARLGSGAHLSIEILGRQGISKQEWELQEQILTQFQAQQTKNDHRVHEGSTEVSDQPVVDEQDPELHSTQESDLASNAGLMFGVMSRMIQEIATMRSEQQQLQEGIVKLHQKVAEIQYEVKNLQADHQRHDFVQSTVIAVLENLQQTHQQSNLTVDSPYPHLHTNWHRQE